MKAFVFISENVGLNNKNLVPYNEKSLSVIDENNDFKYKNFGSKKKKMKALV